MTSKTVAPERTYITAKELADRWGCSIGHLANLRSRGEGPEYLKPMGKVLYPLEAIEAWERATQPEHAKRNGTQGGAK